MATAGLMHRAAQLQVLARACEYRAPARVGLRRPGAAARLHDTRLLALREDSLLLLVPQDESLRRLAGLGVEVIFEHEGEPYAFSAQTRAPADPELWSDPEAPVLRLSLPLCVERRPRRQHVRVRLPQSEPVHARLTNMFDQSFSFDLRMTDISPGGFAGIVDRATAERPSAASPFWAEFTLPGDEERFEYVARLVHCEAQPERDEVVVGWAFCGSDDPTRQARNLVRIERFLARDAAAAQEPGSICLQSEK